MSRCIGVDVGGTTTKLVVWSSDDNRVEALGSIQTLDAAGPDGFYRRLMDHLGDQPYDAIGMAFAGLCDREGTVVQAPNLQSFEGTQPAVELADRLGREALALDNDVNAALRGEHRLGAARGVDDVVMLSLGTGVGGGVLIEGRLVRGSTGLGSELGHTLLDHEGPRCTCGLAGHVESYLSTAAIQGLAASRVADADAAAATTLRQPGDKTVSPRVLSEAAAQGDALAQSILGEVGRWLGIACGNLVNVFNPRLVVIGGGVAGCGEYLLGPAREEMLARAMPGPGAAVQLVATQLGQGGAAVGAAVLALDVLDGAG